MWFLAPPGVCASVRMAPVSTAVPLTPSVSLAGNRIAALMWSQWAGGGCQTWPFATNSWFVAPSTTPFHLLMSSSSDFTPSLLGQIGVSHQLSSVSSFVVDLKSVKKSGGAVIQGIIQDNRPLAEPKDPRGAALRRSYERPAASCSSQRWTTSGVTGLAAK